MNLDWTTGQCHECGDEMKVPEVLIHDLHECKQCRMLAKFERIAYALDEWVRHL